MALRQNTARRVRSLIPLVAALTLAAGQAMVLVPAAGAAEPKVTKPRKVPALPSEPGPRSVPQAQAGDFRNPPSLLVGAPTDSKDSFDPARSTTVADKTTATQKVWRNADGSQTLEISSRPERRKDPVSGEWVSIDLDLTANGAGLLEAKAADTSVRLVTQAEGAPATVQTSAGPLVLRHPEAAAVEAATKDNTATYPAALSGGRDLQLSLVPDGVEQTVILPDAKAPGSYRSEFVLPSGVSARQAEAGVEFVDASGEVVATYGGGVAWDASFPAAGMGAMTGVSIRLLPAVAEDVGTDTVDGDLPTTTTTVVAGASAIGHGTTIVVVEVGVAEEWRLSPDRKYPITIDPTVDLKRDTYNNGRDTFVASGDLANTPLGGHPWLMVGNDGAHTSRSLLWFDLTGLPTGPNVAVSASRLEVYNFYNYAYTCAQGTVSVYRLTSGFTDNTTWNTGQPSIDPTPVSSKTFAHHTGAGSACPGAWESLDTTGLARAWLTDGATNHGLSLRANVEATLTNNKGFVSEDSAGEVNAPKLFITYNQLPPMATAAGPADDTSFAFPTPTLSVNPVTDPDINPNGQHDPVKYWFRVSKTVGVEGGHAIDSGWVDTPSWSVPTGSLDEGTYYWHTFTWDGVTEGFFTVPNWNRKFHLTSRLGSGGPSPTDAFGPVRVNLATGNVALAHASPTLATLGGPMGLSFAYNSQAPGLGLRASYYDIADTAPLPPTMPPVGTPATLARPDPSVAFYWGTGGDPGPGLGTDRYMARWEGYLTAPATGGYRFYVGTTDGVRVWVNDVLTVDGWTEPAGAAGNRTVVADSTTALTANASVKLRVEYFEGTGSANLTLATVMPDGKAQILPPSWLSPETTALPSGWTLSAGAAPLSSFPSATIGSAAVTLTDGLGGLRSFARVGSGFVAPVGEEGVLASAPGGALSFHDTDGTTYMFDPNGHLAAASADTAAASATAPTHSWAGTPLRLRTLTDPVSGQSVTLDYQGGGTSCPPRPDSTFDETPPPGMLCRATYSWNGTQTQLFYKSGRLARIAEAGDVMVDFGYDAANRLNRVRDPLAADGVHLRGLADDDSIRTVVGYATTPGGELDPVGMVASVTLPQPSAATAAARHDYSYPQPGETRITAASVGLARTVTYDDLGRQHLDTDATGAQSALSYLSIDDEVPTDIVDQVVDPAGRRTSIFYDSLGRPTDVWGPAPADCFTHANPPTSTCDDPLGHDHTDYDGGIEGLEGIFWPSDGVVGAAPTVHVTLAEALDGSWEATPPHPSLGSSWSAHLHGLIDLPQGAEHNLRAVGTGEVGLFVDGAPVDPATDAIPGGTHHLMVSVSGTNPTVDLQHQVVGAGSFATVALAWLRPGYGLPTRVQSDDDDGTSPPMVTEIDYEHPETGLATVVTRDPGGKALAETIAYEPAGDERFFRPLSRSRPAGGTTTYEYYEPSDMATPPCPGALNANQAGRLRLVRAPSPDGGATPAYTDEVVYDSAGRVAASRRNAENWTCATHDPRGRLTKLAIAAQGPPLNTDARIVEVAYGLVDAGDARLVKATVSDGTGTSPIETTVDLLGRAVAYRDAWGNASTSAYDQAGRLTDLNGHHGNLHLGHDAAGRVTAQSLDGVTLATAGYLDGELSWATYGNGTSLSEGRDAQNDPLVGLRRDDAGRTRSLTFSQPVPLLGGQPPLLTSDVVERSGLGRVTSAVADGTVTSTFGYDSAGRLVAATVPGHVLAYGYEDSPGCGLSPDAWRNANRSSVTDNGATTAFCYDDADRLVSSTGAAAVGSPTYDPHGNTRTVAGQSLTYDGSDRHVSTTAGTTTVTYTRDATGRIIARTEGASTVHFGFSGPGDSATFSTDDTGGVVLERTIRLLGGVLLTKRLTGDVWSYPNVHGDLVATADPQGAKRGPTLAYDPDGRALGPAGPFAPDGVPDDSWDDFDYGWLGTHQRPLEHGPGLMPVIEMGARPYVPGIGRFLQVDPVEGGSCNAYEYVCGDPTNEFDLTGTHRVPCHITADPPERIGQKIIAGGTVNCDLPVDVIGIEVELQVRVMPGMWVTLASASASELDEAAISLAFEADGVIGNYEYRSKVTIHAQLGPSGDHFHEFRGQRTRRGPNRRIELFQGIKVNRNSDWWPF